MGFVRAPIPACFERIVVDLVDLMVEHAAAESPTSDLDHTRWGPAQNFATTRFKKLERWPSNLGFNA